MSSRPQHQCRFVLLTAIKVTELKPDSAKQDVGKAMKYNVALCAVCDAGGEGNLGLNFKFDILSGEASPLRIQ